MRIRVSRNDLAKLARGEKVPVIRYDGREGTVEIFDEEWMRVGTGFLRRVGKVYANRGYVKVDETKIPIDEFCPDEEWLKKVEKMKKYHTGFFVHWLEPVKIRALAMR